MSDLTHRRKHVLLIKIPEVNNEVIEKRNSINDF